MLTSISFLISKVISQTDLSSRVFLRQQYFNLGLTLNFQKVDSHISQVNLVDGNKANNTPYSLILYVQNIFSLSPQFQVHMAKKSNKFQ